MIAAPSSFFKHIDPFGADDGQYMRDVVAFQAGIGPLLLASIWVQALRPGAVCALLATTGLSAVNYFVDIDAANGESNADVFEPDHTVNTGGCAVDVGNTAFKELTIAGHGALRQGA